MRIKEERKRRAPIGQIFFGGAREQIIKSKIALIFLSKLGPSERPRTEISFIGLSNQRILNYSININMILLSIKDPLV